MFSIEDYRQVVNYKVMESRVPTTNYNSFEINTNVSKYKLVNKFVEWIVEKLKKRGILKYRVQYVDETNFKSFEINFNTIYRELREQLNYFEYRGERIGMIVLGNKQMHQLMRCDELRHCININMPLEVPNKLMGVKLVLNPYIDGIVFIPQSCM